MPKDPRSVFVVHGRNESLRNALFEFLRAIGLQPLEWTQAVALTSVGTPYIGQVLDAAFQHAQAVVVLLTPDEVVYLRPEVAGNADDPETEPAAQARPNVLFEAGMAFGHNPSHTVLVEVGTLRPFSDVVGRHAVRLRNDPESRHALVQRLQSAGCAVDLSGTDWLTAGDFTPPSEPGAATNADAVIAGIRDSVALLTVDGHPSGMGVLVAPHRIATLKSVLERHSSRGNGRILLTYARGAEAPRVLLPGDASNDVSILSTSATLPALPFEDAQRIAIGDTVLVPTFTGLGRDELEVLTARFDGLTLSGDLLLRGIQVRRQHEGAPVLTGSGALVGMICQTTATTGGPVARAVSVRTIRDSLGAITGDGHV